MNEKKICFISCVNKIEDYEECMLYLKHLEVPHGMEIEVLSVEGAECMTAGYNSAMHSSDAKYKIYLHQDVFIFKRDFLRILIRTFQQKPEIGLLGLAGCRKLPPSGIWWFADEMYANLIEVLTPEWAQPHRRGDGMQGDFSYMQAVDGFLMATQYDVEWREDLFRGWHFYDISASMEFQKAGYKVAVLRQDEPWCIHECGDKWLDDEYRKWQEVFRQTYGFEDPADEQTEMI